MSLTKIKSLILTAAFAGLCCCVNESKDGDSIINVGDKIPPFSVSAPDGQTVSSSDFSGRGGLIVLFASYCGSCREELPEIEKIWKASEEGSLFVVAPLSRQSGSESKEKVAALWLEEGYSMPYFLDTGGEVYGRFAGQWIPRIYVVDKEQKVTFMTVGESDVTASRIASELEKALGIHVSVR